MAETLSPRGKKETKKDKKAAAAQPVSLRIVIVGASSGMGMELARAYARTKPANRIAIAARRVDRLEALAVDMVKDGAEVICVPTDATKQADCVALMKTAADKWGGLDLMVYCVGQAMHVLFADITNVEKVCSAMMDTNFTGCVWCTHAAYPYLKASRGQCVAISSVAGSLSPPYLCFYAAAKHALHGFYESLQNEENGVDYTLVCPGYVATEIDDKKMVGDGSVQSVELNTDKNKYMPAPEAAALIIDAQRKKKKCYQLTGSGAAAAVFHSLMPGTINKAVKSEMKKISSVDVDSGKDDKGKGKSAAGAAAATTAPAPASPAAEPPK